MSAAHDISDGGLIGCILEMAFAGKIPFLFASLMGMIFDNVWCVHGFCGSRNLYKKLSKKDMQCV